MVKKCIYCGKALSEEIVIDVCWNCGVKVWGEKMFKAIVHNMEDAKDRGDLVLEHEIVETEESR